MHPHTPSALVSGLLSEPYIGLMSGTSLDGVDGVLMRHDHGQWRTLAHEHRPFPPALRQALLAFATEGDWTTPTCPSCGVKMAARDSSRGRFWGCIRYPKCRATLPMRTASAQSTS